MNELIFLIHIMCIISFTIISLKIGKEALITFICLSTVLANLFITKQITLFGLHPTASESFIIGSIFGINLLQEYFGTKTSKRAILICFFCLIFYAITSQIHLIYSPNIYDYAHDHFQAILKFMPRIAFSSIFVTVFVQYFSRMLYEFLKKTYSETSFILRNQFTLSISMLLDSILFTFLGLYGIVSNIWQIIIFSYIIKLTAILLVTPILALIKTRLKL